MPTRRSWWLLVLSSCVRAVPVPSPTPLPPPPPPVIVPGGCLADQSGALRHETDGRFQYQAVDDGGELTVSVFFVPIVDAGRPPRRFSRDGGLAWLVPTPDAGVPGAEGWTDAGASSISQLSLRRTPTGFVGLVSAQTDGGCAFPVRVTACEPAALVLETITRQPRTCATGTDAGWTRQRLLRPGFDAGEEASDTLRHDVTQDGGAAVALDGGSHATPPPAP